MARRPIEPQIKQDLKRRTEEEFKKPTDAVIDHLLKIIIAGEETNFDKRSRKKLNPYDTVFGYGRFLKPGQPDPERNTPTANKPISKMTFKEVKEFGRALVNATKGKINRGENGTSAVGAFQLLANNYNTNSPIVENLQKRLGYKDTDIFTPETQNKLAKALIVEIASKELYNYVREPSSENANDLINRIGIGGNVTINPKTGKKVRTTDGWEGVNSSFTGRSTTKTPKLPFGSDAVEKLIKEYNKNPLSKDVGRDMLVSKLSTSGQMSDLGFSSDQSETQSNPNEDRLDDNVDRAMDRFRDILKDKETIKTLKQIQNARDLLEVLGTGPARSASGVVDNLLKSKNIEKEVDKLNDNDSFSIYNYLREAVNEIIGVKPAGAAEKISIDGIKTLQEKFKDMTASMGPVIDTSDTAKQTKELFSDPVISEEAESLPRGDAGSGTMTFGAGTQFDKVDIDNDARTEGILTRENLGDPAGSPLPGIEPPMGEVVPPPRRTNDINLALANERSETQLNPSEIRAMEDESFAEEGGESDDFSPNYSIVDSIPMEDANEIGSGNELDPERNRETRERSEVDFDYFADEAQPMGGEFEGDDIDAGSGPVDFSFIKSLFSGGFDAGRDSDSELNIDADYFYDEVNPVGGEADPNDDVARFDEGGTADFDGKKEEKDDEGDPPPLAKPEEVADDIPAMLSEGEYVLPANVVRYLGLERIMDMHRQVLSEIQQMEDLGMIQNVDKNGEPEEDDKEMKFLESEKPEEGEEAVSKGTLIIASSKPKGMMCPEPLRFAPGGSTSGDDGSGTGGGNPSGGPNSPSEATGASNPPNEINDTGSGTEDPGRDFGGFDPGPNQNETADIDEYNTVPELEKAKQKEKNKEKDQTELQEIFSKIENPTMVEKGLFGLGRFAEEVLGVEVTEARAREREKAEAEASQPGDSDDDELDGTIKDKDIKVNKVNDVIADLKDKNVYIPGIGYFPLQGLMSPQDTTIV